MMWSKQMFCFLFLYLIDVYDAAPGIGHLGEDISDLLESFSDFFHGSDTKEGIQNMDHRIYDQEVETISKINTPDNNSTCDPLPKNECGLTRFDKVKGRIINGEKANLGQFPWIVRIGHALSKLSTPVFVCGGALISKKLVVTAAHCGTENNVVRVGENNANTDPDCDDEVCAPPPQDIRIKKYLINIYDKDKLQDDINLICLEKEVKFNDYVIPICLPNGDLLKKNMMGRHMKIAGWGYTNSTYDSQSDDLLYVVEPVVEQSQCNALYENPLTDKQYCIGFDQGKDSCAGDSGGPVSKSMKVNGDRRVYLFGIVSYGLVDCGNGPAVYTAVAKYVDIIMEKMKECC